ncbi:MAG: CBS domain-containing protein [Candidatus Omnitrophota bacterium]|jgi:CBS domain-containing protein
MSKPFDEVLIEEIMTTKVIVLKPGENMSDACIKMRTNKIRHLPVVDVDNKLIGLFTDRDLNRAYSPKETESGWYYSKSELETLSLEHFMTKDPHALNPQNTLKDAAKIMAFHKYGCIPIAEAATKKILGIITYVDMFRYLSNS